MLEKILNMKGKLDETSGQMLRYEVKRGRRLYHSGTLHECQDNFKPVGYYSLPCGGTRYTYRCLCSEFSFTK